MILSIFADAVIAIISLPGIYLGYTTTRAVIFWNARTPTSPDHDPENKSAPGTIAFVIPAHNESDVIVRTITSLKELQDQNFTINVVADNCSDDTASLARKHGAMVYERFDNTHKSKGHALAWLIPKVISDHASKHGAPPLAIVVVDADATMTPFSASFARQRFAKGQNILQSAYSQEPGTSSRSKVAGIAFSAINIVRGYARAAMNISDTLKGNGMWFRAEVLMTHPWKSFSLAEDLEFGLMLRQKGYKIEFFGESVVTGLPGEGHTASSNQRARWESGRLALVMEQLPSAARDWLKNPSWDNLDLVMELVTPPLTFYVVALLVSTVAAYISNGALWLPTLALLCVTGHLISAIPLGGLPWSALSHLAGVPLFFAWKIRLLPRIWRDRASKVWIRTERDRK